MERPPFRTQERISWGLAALSVALAFGFGGALDAYLDVRSPSAHDMAEPFMAVWGSGTVATIVLLSFGAVALGGWWRPLVILSPIPIAGLVWLWINNLLGAVGDRSVSHDGLTVGALMSAQLVVFVAWLGIILWWRDTWSRIRAVLALASAATALLGAWNLGLPWYGPLYPDYGEPAAVWVVLSAWGPLAAAAIGCLACASGDSGTVRPLLRSSALLFVATLWLTYLYVASYAVVTDRLYDTALVALALALGLLVVLSAWLALVWRWATIRP